MDGDATKTVDVNHGEDGPLVTAIPMNDYVFVNWSDGVNSNPRQDINVMGNISVSANFVKQTNGLTKLQVSIIEPVSNATFKYNAWVNIKVKTTDQNGQPVADAAVAVTVENPNGAIVGTYTGSTGTDGIFTASYRVPNKSLTGEYAISATAVKEGLVEIDSEKFNVIGR